MTLSDKRRRMLLRGLFFAVVVIPCAGTLAWAFFLRTDVYRTSWEESLSSSLGMRVTIDAVRQPHLGALLFEGVRCYDPETDAQVVDVRTVEGEDFSDGRHLKLNHATIFADRGAQLFSVLERRLRRESTDSETSTTLSAGELTWRTATESQTLVNVRAMLGPIDDARQLLVNFGLPGTSEQHPVSLRISRQASTATPTTSIELDTGAVVLPCSLFTPLTDAIAAVGAQARFSGRMKVRHTADGWDGVVTGDVSEADLDALVSSRFPHLLSGLAELRVHHAELTRGRLERGTLTIIAGPGQVSRSLVVAGGAFLGMGVVEAQLPPDSMLLFDRLACDVAMDESGVTIRGRTTERPGAVLWKDDLVYWREPAGGAQPAANLLRALVPFTELQVPAAMQTANLMQWLPLSRPTRIQSPTATPSSTAPPSATRIRVRETP